MKIKTKALKTALANLSHVAARKVSLPILSCAKITAVENTLFIAVTNLDERQIETVECDGPLDECCVNFKTLDYSCGGDEMEITLGGDRLIVRFGQNIQKFATLPAEDFPKEPNNKLKQVGVSCVDLADAIESVKWAASTDLGRYVMNSVRVEGEPKLLTCVATDGRCVAVAKKSVISAKFEATVPKEFTGNLVDSLRREGSSLWLDEKGIHVTHATGSYSCKQLDGVYPNWGQVIPDAPPKIGSLNIPAAREIYGRLETLLDGRTDSSKLTFASDGLTIEYLSESTLTYSVAGEFRAIQIAMAVPLMNRILTVDQLTADVFGTEQCH